MDTRDIDGMVAWRLREVCDEMLLPPPQGLAEADCASTSKMVARLAVSAASLGSSETDWRWYMYRHFPLVAGRRLDDAVSCMRETGLWPWREATTP